jgi:hypothetical protein
MREHCWISTFSGKITSIFLTSFLIFNISLCNSQRNDKLNESFKNYAINNINEKVYAHLNRTDNITGEILWFKIYCVDGRLHQPLNISRIAYAEILDSDNTPVLQTKVALNEGQGSGSFYLPATLPSGNYLFRAYTNWMKNSQAEYYFQKKISIVNTVKPNEQPSARITNPSLDVQFFPEGGNLLEGVRTKIGFKVVDSKGNSLDFSGAIVNQSRDTIVKFKTLKFGMGNFLFKPEANQTYTAVLINKKNQSFTFDFVEIKKLGYSLMVNDIDNDRIKIIVNNPEGILTTQLFIHTRHSIKVSEIKTTREKIAAFIVDKNKLGAGISHITILDQEGLPVCERLYFKKPSNNLILNSAVDQKEYSIRRRVQLNIENKQSLDGNISISVFRGDSINSNQNIVNYLFLESDLIGKVESPEYYFSDEMGVDQAADNLMLTQGWRRFNWESIVENKPIVKFLPEIKGHLIQGQILDENNKPVKNKVGYLATPGKKIRLYVSKSDTAGIVRFQMKDFQETGKIIAQTNYELDSLSHIEIEKPYSKEYATWNFTELQLNNSIEDELIERSVGMQVQDAFYEDETYFQFKKMDTDSIPFYGEADEIYLLDDYTRFPVFEEVIREYVKGVWVRKKKDDYRFMVIDKVKNELFRDNPLTLLDGVPIFDINKVLQIDPLKIKKLEVMTRRYFLGPLELNGIISLSTYNGDLGGIELDPRSVTLDYEGLQSQREFYSPRYTTPDLRGSRLPDQRHQLYWNPNVKLIDGEVNSINFYTSDVEGNFFIAIEGLSNNGLPGYSSTSFKVSK